MEKQPSEWDTRVLEALKKLDGKATTQRIAQALNSRVNVVSRSLWKSWPDHVLTLDVLGIGATRVWEVVGYQGEFTDGKKSQNIIYVPVSH